MVCPVGRWGAVAFGIGMLIIRRLKHAKDLLQGGRVAAVTYCLDYLFSDPVAQHILRIHASHGLKALLCGDAEGSIRIGSGLPVTRQLWLRGLSVGGLVQQRLILSAAQRAKGERVIHAVGLHQRIEIV